MGDRTNTEGDVLERITGKVIFRVSMRFIRDQKINGFIEEIGISEGAELIYKKWENAFGKAVYEEFNVIDLSGSDNNFRKAAQSTYETYA